MIHLQKGLDASRRAFAEAPWCGTEHTSTFQVDMFVVFEKNSAVIVQQYLKTKSLSHLIEGVSITFQHLQLHMTS